MVQVYFESIKNLVYTEVYFEPVFEIYILKSREKVVKCKHTSYFEILVIHFLIQKYA